LVRASFGCASVSISSRISSGRIGTPVSAPSSRTTQHNSVRRRLFNDTSFPPVTAVEDITGVQDIRSEE